LKVLEVAAVAGGWVLLLGVDHTVNTTIHVAEHLEHRGRFTRFARVDDRPEGWVAVHNLGGQSDGFGAIDPHLQPYTREATIGAARCQAVPGSRVIEVVRRLIRADLAALLDRSAGGRAAAAVAQRLAYLAYFARGRR
jgi:aminoglycoside 3-N-acetyltransferase